MLEAVTVGGVRHSWITNLSLNRPEIRSKYMKQYGDQFSEFFDFIQDHCMTEGVSSTTYSHYEEGKRHGYDTVATANPTPGAANAAHVVVITNQTIGTETDLVFGQENDDIEFPGGVRAIVQSTSWNGTNWEFTCIPKELGEAIPAVAVNDVLINHGNAMGEGTGQPSSRRTPFEIETGCLQIQKETFEITGTAKTDDEWVTWSVEGEGNFTYHYEQLRAEEAIKRKIAQMMLTGTKITNTLAQKDKDGNDRTASEGAITFARTRGNLITVATTAMTLNNFDDIEAYSAKMRSDGVQLVMTALERGQNLNKLFKTEFQDANNAAVLQRFRNKDLSAFDDMSLAATRNYKLLVMTKNQYIFTGLDLLNDPQMYNASAAHGSRYQSLGLILPFDTVKNPETKTWGPKFGFTYKKFGNYSRLMEIWPDGSAKPAGRLGPIDNDLLYIRTDTGSRFACGKQWQLITA